MTSRQATGVLVIAGLAVLLLRKRSTTITNGVTVPDTVNAPGAVVIGNKPIEVTPPFNGGGYGQPAIGSIVTGNACRYQVQCFRAPCPCESIDLGSGGNGNISDEPLPVWHLL